MHIQLAILAGKCSPPRTWRPLLPIIGGALPMMGMPRSGAWPVVGVATAAGAA